MTTTAQVLASRGELITVLEDRGFACGLLMEAFLAEPAKDRVQKLAESGAVDLYPYGDRSASIRQGMDEVLA